MVESENSEMSEKAKADQVVKDFIGALMPPRRVKIFGLSLSDVLAFVALSFKIDADAEHRGCLLPRGVRFVDFELPADVRIVGCHVDPMRNVAALFLESEEFEPVPAGSEAPLLTEGNSSPKIEYCTRPQAIATWFKSMPEPEQQEFLASIHPVE